MTDARPPVRIGGASAFLGDSPFATAQLLTVPDLDYLVYDFLAEVTLSVLARSRSKSAERGGWAPDFVNIVLRENLPEIARRGIRVVANAGGLNPQACGDAVRALVAELGLDLKVAVIAGDDILPRIDEFRTTEMFTGAPMPERLLSANAYLGGVPIARALGMGAQIVVTGRVVDSALALGPLMHEFGWQSDDPLRMAQGTTAGHLIECGAQITGGTFTDWFDGDDWSSIGYPVVECFEDGRMVVTKPEGTGGIVSRGTVGEQLLYEVDDPANYVVPDAICDFTRVQLRELGPNRVEVTGVVGRPPTDSYKVCATLQDGFRCTVILPVVGMNARQKAQRQADALIERNEREAVARGMGRFTTRHVELLGLEASYGANARPLDSREVVSKIVVDHPRREALELIAIDALSPTTSMSPGSTGWHGGRPPVMPMMRVFSFLAPKSWVPATIDMDGRRTVVDAWIGGGSVDRALALSVPEPAPERAEPMQTVRLVDLAWGRSGDKGNRFMMAVIARQPEYLPWIRRALTPATLGGFMRHVFDRPDAPMVEVFEAPGISALNLLFHDALRGGQMASPRLDPLAKAMAQQVLELTLEVPARLRVERHQDRMEAALSRARPGAGTDTAAVPIAPADMPRHPATAPAAEPEFS